MFACAGLDEGGLLASPLGRDEADEAEEACPRAYAKVEDEACD